jgi:predicted metal-dependent peptidase
VDSSCSVRPEEFNYFIAEIQAIQEYMHPNRITLICFDTKIQDIFHITEGMNVLRDIKFKGGGGTCVFPVMDYVIKHKPDLTLVFTDGEFEIPKTLPTTELIWLIHNNPYFKINHGKIINYNI